VSVEQRRAYGDAVEPTLRLPNVVEGYDDLRSKRWVMRKRRRRKELSNWEISKLCN
jgi:hypothetical protein